MLKINTSMSNLLSKIGFDTAEHEPSEVGYRSPQDLPPLWRSAAPALQTEESARGQGRPRVPSANCLLGAPRLISLSLPQLDSKARSATFALSDFQ